MVKTAEINPGQRFGKLVVQQRVDNLGNAVAYECLCDCGNTKIARSYALHNGQIRSCGCLHKEVMQEKRGKPKTKRRLVCGVGLVDVDYPVKDCPIHAVWDRMLRRCFDEKERLKNPSYLSSKAAEDWLLFSNFKEWAINRYKPGLDLDKDILVEGNKDYGPETCSFVPRRINSLLTDRKMDRGDLPLGVNYMHKTKVMINERSKPYVARVNTGNGRKFLGHFATPEEAHKAWQIGKAKVIEDAVFWWATQDSFDTYCADALLKRAWDLQIKAFIGVSTEGF